MLSENSDSVSCNRTAAFPTWFRAKCQQPNPLSLRCHHLLRRTTISCISFWSKFPISCVTVVFPYCKGFVPFGQVSHEFFHFFPCCFLRRFTSPLLSRPYSARNKVGLPMKRSNYSCGFLRFRTARCKVGIRSVLILHLPTGSCCKDCSAVMLYASLACEYPACFAKTTESLFLSVIFQHENSLVSRKHPP